MSSEGRGIAWLRMEGAPREIGVALGRAGREAVHRDLLTCDYWRSVTDRRHAMRVGQLAESTRQRFPSIWAEIAGMAEGLDLPFEMVMAWNCRGDLLASAPDGCTTVMIPGTAPMLAHNEDGLPFFRGACFMADIAPAGQPGFKAFCYPGSIPGHSFAFTDRGLVQTVNNLRLTTVTPTIPRMVLGRAILTADSIDAAVSMLEDGANSAGFHVALGHARDRRLVSIEYGAGEVAVREVTAPAAHANHALYHRQGLAHQIVTRSSADRQRRAEALLSAGAGPLVILGDIEGDGLPIRRESPEDPDNENTLATVVFQIGGGRVHWRIHENAIGDPVHAGTTS